MEDSKELIFKQEVIKKKSVGHEVTYSIITSILKIRKNATENIIIHCITNVS